MRIKRFTAPDMRAALRLVRDEQGPDAVILSNRPIDGGVEVVAATDYDEALVQQALRAAAPGLQMPAPKPRVEQSDDRGASAMPMPAAAQARDSDATQTARPAAETGAAASRPSLAQRARAVFRIGGDDDASTATPATLAELAAAPAAPAAPSVARSGGSPRFEAMMAALLPADGPSPQPPATITTADTHAAAHEPVARTHGSSLPSPSANAHVRAPTTRAIEDVRSPGHGHGEQVPATRRARFDVPAFTLAPMEPAASETTREACDAPLLTLAPMEPALATPREAMASAPESPAAAPQRHDAGDAPALQLVAGRDLDPAMTAMRDELAAMRQLIEREMGRLVVDRLRGSPARAAAYDALIEGGCDAALAQSIAASLDPTLDPERVHAPMLAQLGQRLRVTRAEPIEDGGVIALIGPTGAGKTTTLAKLAARFAARHRARDVALVTTDQTRAGAREQLQAHGRRLGITVCEAAGPEGLPEALAQLQDYPLVLVDTAGHAARGRAMLGQLAWLRGDRRVRSLLVLPANAHPQDLDDVVRRYRLAAPEGVILTKLDETGRLGAALSMLIRNELSLAYVCDGQEVPADLAAADIPRLLLRLQKPRRAADNPAHAEDRHAVA